MAAKKIAVPEGGAVATRKLRDLAAGAPSSAQLTQTSGEGTGPAYGYHQTMTQVAQFFSAQFGEFTTAMSSLESWMSSSIADLEATNEAAATALRGLSGELEGYAALHAGRGYGEQSVRPVSEMGEAAGTNDRTEVTGWGSIA